MGDKLTTKALIDELEKTASTLEALALNDAKTASQNGFAPATEAMDRGYSFINALAEGMGVY